MQVALLQLLEDFLSAIVFVIVYALTKHLVLATVLAIAIAVGQFAHGTLKKRPFSIMRWMALALAVGLGSLTLLTHDSRFIQLKPTIAHFAIGAAMLKRGWLQRYLPPLAREWLPEGTIVRWGYAWAVLMLAMGAANIAATQWLSLTAWGGFLTGLLLAKILFGTLQYFSMRQIVVRRMLAGATNPAA